MISISFTGANGSLTGFEIKGHSGYADEGSDIVCASVSSAAYMAVNTVTQVLGIKAQAKVSDAYFYFSAYGESDARVNDILEGLRLHLRQLSGQYPAYVTILNDNQ